MPARKKKKPEVEVKSATESSESSSEDTENSSDDDSEVEVKLSKKKRPSDFINKKDRPDHLKSDRKINALTLDEAIAICKLSAKRAKLDSSAVDTDDKPERITYKKFKDNGIDKLHPARFERQPTIAPTKYWSSVPIKRTNIIKKIPLRHLGKILTIIIANSLLCEYFRSQSPDPHKDNHECP